MNLQQFLKQSFVDNLWISEKHIKIYVRRSNRILTARTFLETQKFYPCLDIASVEVSENRRGKGIFKKFLTRVERQAKKLKRAVYVESILDPRLVDFLTRRGYTSAPNLRSESMYKIIT